jgi:S1-C subfamily serine protease
MLHEIGNGIFGRLVHTVPNGKYRSDHAQGFQQQWTLTLANLALVLETGLDKRVFDRPRLGINISDFTAEFAQTMGVPISDGIRLDFLPENLSAFQSGLRKDDIIITLGGKAITKDLESLASAIHSMKKRR